MEDKDVSFQMERDQFLELAKPVLERVEKPLAKALEDSGLSKDDIHSVELVGSASRVPAVLTTITSVFGKEGGRTLNASESVSRGCALQCAMLSPTFKVREFDVHDICPFPVEFQWTGGPGDTEVVTNEVFKANNDVPSSKMMTFFRSESFTLKARYGAAARLPAGFEADIGEYTVGPFTYPEGKDKAKLKVKAKLNLHGVLTVESAQTVVEEEVVVEEDAKMEDAAAPAADAKAADAKAEDAPTADAAAAGEPMETEKKTVKKVHKTDVPVASKVLSLSATELQAFTEREFDMRLQDRVQEETKAKKNEVEEYVYDKRSKLFDSLEAYVSEGEKEKFSALLSATEDWLYEDGEDETKGVYAAKLEELKAMGEPIEERYADDQTRGDAAAALTALCNSYTEFATSHNPLYAHIEASEKERALTECTEAAKWLAEKMAAQEAQPKHADPVLKTGDLVKKRDTVERVCKPIMSKPAPPPPPPVEGEAMETGDGAAAGGEPMQADLD
mmetsp:Transcript_57811/g.183308  ORF Transcript_57811/g.183308 Transcript_57811/m.183308 type:complete len:504 (-) Transcript_57811:37-1548(-)